MKIHYTKTLEILWFSCSFVPLPFYMLIIIIMGLGYSGAK